MMLGAGVSVASSVGGHHCNSLIISSQCRQCRGHLYLSLNAWNVHAESALVSGIKVKSDIEDETLKSVINLIG